MGSKSLSEEFQKQSWSFWFLRNILTKKKGRERSTNLHNGGNVSTENSSNFEISAFYC